MVSPNSWVFLSSCCSILWLDHPQHVSLHTFDYAYPGCCWIYLNLCCMYTNWWAKVWVSLQVIQGKNTRMCWNVSSVYAKGSRRFDTRSKCVRCPGLRKVVSISNAPVVLMCPARHYPSHIICATMTDSELCWKKKERQLKPQNPK